MPATEDQRTAEPSIIASILKPFLGQFRWGKPTTKRGNKAWKIFFDKLFGNVIDDDPLAIFFGNSNIESLGISFYVTAAVPLIVALLATVARFFVGFPGAFFEWIERKIEAKFPSYPGLLLKLPFYLLKQPFQWAETAISSAGHLVSCVFLGLYSAACHLPLLLGGDKEKAERSFKCFRQYGLITLGRLVLVGAIGAAAYFGGVPAVSALAGTMGPVGAACAVTGAGLVGVTAIQSVALSLYRFVAGRGGSGASSKPSGTDTSTITQQTGPSESSKNEKKDEEKVVKHIQTVPEARSSTSGFFSDSADSAQSSTPPKTSPPTEKVKPYHTPKRRGSAPEE